MLTIGPPKWTSPFLLLIFQAIESLVESDIIPFDGGDLVVLYPSKGINEVSTQAGVDVIRLEAPQAGAVLGPVGEVACQLVAGTCGLERGRAMAWLRCR